jgi:hypothetical protein
MKNAILNFFLVLVGVLAVPLYSEACSIQTIDAMVDPIDPYESFSAKKNLQAVLENLQLCDENLFYAGDKVAKKFDPFYTRSSLFMSDIVRSNSSGLSEELASGLGLGLIDGIDLFYNNSTIYMLEAILQLARDHSNNAKQFAIELLKKSDPYYKAINNELLKAVRTLRELANSTSNPQLPSSIWSFRSEERTCKDISGPWGYYYPCPRYTASIADAKGNRLILSCRSNEHGINFRIRPSRELWNKVSNSEINTISFATNTINQQMGVPYMISEDGAIYVEESISEELLDRLRADKFLNIKMRLNSGESSAVLNYKLSGSNKAITKLMSYCQ